MATFEELPAEAVPQADLGDMLLDEFLPILGPTLPAQTERAHAKMDIAQEGVNQAVQRLRQASAGRQGGREQARSELMQAVEAARAERGAPPPEGALPPVEEAPSNGGVGLSTGQQLMEQGLGMALPLVGSVSSPRSLFNERNALIEANERAGLQANEAQRALLGEQAETAAFTAEQHTQRADDLYEQALGEEERQLVEMERRERIFQETEAQLRVTQEATQHLANTPPEDPGRWWKDASAGKRAGFVLGSIFYGMLGGNPLEIINKAIDRDIDAQRSEFNRRSVVANAQSQQLGQQRNIWADLRANATTDNEAVLLTRAAYTEAFKQNLIAGLHQRGQAEMVPLHQQILAQLDAQAAQLVFRAQAERAANTRRIYRKQNFRIDPETGKPIPISSQEAAIRRKFGEKLFDAGIKSDENVRTAQLDFDKQVGVKRAEASIEAEAAAAAQASGDTKDDRLDIRSLARDDKYKAATNMSIVLGNMIKIGQENGGEAPGVVGPIGAPGPLRSKEKRAWDRQADLGAQIGINFLTGAVSNEKQDAVAGALYGEGTWTAEQRLEAIIHAKEIVDQFITAQEAMLREPARQQVHRNPGLPGVSPSSVVDAPTREAAEALVEHDE